MLVDCLVDRAGVVVLNSLVVTTLLEAVCMSVDVSGSPVCEIFFEVGKGVVLWVVVLTDSVKIVVSLIVGVDGSPVLV